MAKTHELLYEIYRRLEDAYGDQRWWPGDTPLEVAVGAILTQNTAWTNVAKAIANIKGAALMDAHKLLAAPPAHLAALIKPAGYYNIKLRRLRAFLEMVVADFAGDVTALAGAPDARARLLRVKGIGPETADSILLYACGVPTFVVDAYTRRILCRHDLAAEDATYDELKELFELNLAADVRLFNQYHALLVRVGKERCRPREPRCAGCPLAFLTRS